LNGYEMCKHRHSACPRSASFGGDPERIYVGSDSSGGHLCGVALVTDWQKDFGLPANTVKGGLCMSGMYEMTPVRLSCVAPT
jgi:arylformamidase